MMSQLFHLSKRINLFLYLTFFITSFFILSPDIAFADNSEDKVPSVTLILIVNFLSFIFAPAILHGLSNSIGDTLAFIITGLIMAMPIFISMSMTIAYIYENNIHQIALTLLGVILFIIAGYHVHELMQKDNQQDKNNQDINNNL